MTTTTTTSPRYLTDTQIASYHREGYLALPRFLDAERVEALRRVTDAFVERSRGIARTDPCSISTRGTPRRPRSCGASRTPPIRIRSISGWVRGLADPRRRQRADRFLAALPPQQAEPQGRSDRRARRGAPGRRVLSALQRRRARGGPAARRCHGRERRDGGAARQSPRADPHALRRQGAIRRLYARRGHRQAGSPRRGAARPARGQHPHPPLPARFTGPRPTPRPAIAASHQLLRRRRFHQPRIRLHQVSDVRPPRCAARGPQSHAAPPATCRCRPTSARATTRSTKSRPRPRRRREDVARRARRDAGRGTSVRRARRVARLDKPERGSLAPHPPEGARSVGCPTSATRSPRRE